MAEGEDLQPPQGDDWDKEPQLPDVAMEFESRLLDTFSLIRHSHTVSMTADFDQSKGGLNAHLLGANIVVTTHNLMSDTRLAQNRGGNPPPSPFYPYEMPGEALDVQFTVNYGNKVVLDLTLDTDFYPEIIRHNRTGLDEFDVLFGSLDEGENFESIATTYAALFNDSPEAIDSFRYDDDLHRKFMLKCYQAVQQYATQQTELYETGQIIMPDDSRFKLEVDRPHFNGNGVPQEPMPEEIKFEAYNAADNRYLAYRRGPDGYSISVYQHPTINLYESTRDAGFNDETRLFFTTHKQADFDIEMAFVQYGDPFLTEMSHKLLSHDEWLLPYKPPGGSVII